MIGIESYYFLVIVLGLILASTVVSYFDKSTNTYAFAKIFCIFSFLGNSILSIALAGGIAKGMENQSFSFEWFSYHQINVSFSVMVDEFAVSIMAFLQMTGFLASVYFFVLKDSARKKQASAFYLLILMLSVMVVAENFITFVMGCIASGYVFNHMFATAFFEQNQKKSIFLVIMYRISNVLMLVGLLGFLRIFQTDSFIAFKEQEVLANIAMKNDVIVYGLLIVGSFLLKWLQVPLMYLVSHLNSCRLTTALYLAWSLQMLAGVVLISRISVVFISLDQITNIAVWFLICSLLCAGALALVQEKIRNSLSYVIVGLNSIVLLMCFLGQVTSVILYLFSIIVGITMVAKIVDINTTAGVPRSRKITLPPISVIIYSVLALAILFGFVGTPSYFSVVELIKAMSLKGGVFRYVLLIIGWLIIGLAISKIIARCLVSINKSEWEKIYTRKDKIVLFISSVIVIALLVINHAAIDRVTQLSFQGFIGRAVHALTIETDQLMPTYITIGFLSFVPLLLIYYLYVVRFDENIAKKIEDSFPVVIEWLRNDLYMERLVRMIFLTFPQRITQVGITIMNNYVPRLIVSIKHGTVSLISAILVIENEKSIDGIIAIISICMVIISFIVMFRFII